MQSARVLMCGLFTLANDNHVHMDIPIAVVLHSGVICMVSGASTDYKSGQFFSRGKYAVVLCPLEVNK